MSGQRDEDEDADKEENAEDIQALTENIESKTVCRQAEPRAHPAASSPFGSSEGSRSGKTRLGESSERGPPGALLTTHCLTMTHGGTLDDLGHR